MFHSAPAITALQDGSSEYPGWNAFRQVRVSDPPSVRVGQWPPVDVMPGPNGLYAMGVKMVGSVWWSPGMSGIVPALFVVFLFRLPVWSMTSPWDCVTSP